MEDVGEVTEAGIGSVRTAMSSGEEISSLLPCVLTTLQLRHLDTTSTGGVSMSKDRRGILCAKGTDEETSSSLLLCVVVTTSRCTGTTSDIGVSSSKDARTDAAENGGIAEAARGGVGSVGATEVVFKGPVQSGFLPKFGRTGTVTGH